jgi:hypothetical protein
LTFCTLSSFEHLETRAAELLASAGANGTGERHIDIVQIAGWVASHYVVVIGERVRAISARGTLVRQPDARESIPQPEVSAVHLCHAED